jgi:glycosyltransferase involved in cell wall biosynthesis
MLDRAFVWYQELFGYPDTEKEWIVPLISAVRHVAKECRIDAILSEYPIASHVAASAMKSELGVPWIADFVDLWSDNHSYPFGRLRKMLDRRLEYLVLSGADRIITVSEPWADKLRLLHGPERVKCIEHGFDEKDLNDPPIKPATKFIISYTGRVYSEMQDPEPFFAALSDFVSKSTVTAADVEVRFFGDQERWILEQIRSHGLESYVSLYGRLPKSEIIHKQRESQLLLLLAVEGRQRLGCYTSKLYSYLAAQRPILVCGGVENDVLDVLIKNTSAGFYCKDRRAIADVLRSAYGEFKSTGAVRYKASKDAWQRYTYQNMTSRFVDQLNSLKASDIKTNYSNSETDSVELNHFFQ